MSTESKIKQSQKAIPLDNLITNPNDKSRLTFFEKMKGAIVTNFGKPKVIDVANQTIFISGPRANMGDVALGHWFKSRSSNKNIADIVIDLAASTMTYAKVASTLKEDETQRDFHLLNMTTQNEKLKLSYTNTFKSDDAQVAALLNASIYSIECSEADTESTTPMSSMTMEEKVIHLSQPFSFSLFSLLERTAGEGLSIGELFSPNSTTAIILPDLISLPLANNVFVDMLNLIKNHQDVSGKAVRITILGVKRHTHIPNNLVEWLFNSDNVEVIAQCQYPVKQKESWLNDAIEYSSQTFMSRAENENKIPRTVNALTHILTNMKHGDRKSLPATMLSNGVLASEVVKLEFPKLPLHRDIDRPKHANGNLLNQ